MNRAVALLALGAALGGSPALAQTNTTPAAVEFLPRVAFHLSAEHLGSSDRRFIWDANFGGELDIVDYGVGRAMFVGNYQTILGNELRRFDPNQGNYVLQGSASARTAGLELALVFHHESRHLSDRPKRVPVDWNMLGGRLRKAAALGAVRVDARADLRGTVKKSFVDYRWELDAGVRSVYPLAPSLSAISDVDLRVLGVDGTQNRATQTGFRVEGGVRIQGGAGAVELFVAGERRIDPYPLEFGTSSWVVAGFRLLSR